MRTQINRWFAPPLYPNDETKTRQADLLNSALINIATLIPIILIGNWLGGKTPFLVFLADVLALALCGILRFWMDRGKLRLAGIGLIAMGFVLVTLSVAALGTIRVPSTAMYLLLIITASLLFDLSGMILAIALASLLIGGLIVAENTGLLPPPDYSVTITQWVSYTAIGSWTGSLIFSAIRIMRQALARADKEIAERKQTEEALRHSQKELEARERLWNDTFNAIGEYVSVLDREFRITRVNRALADWIGKKPQELIGKRCYEILHGLNLPWSNCPHLEAIRTGQAVTEQIDDPHLGCLLQVSASPIFDQTGYMVGSVHIAKDITERKQADELIRQEAKRGKLLLALYEQAPNLTEREVYDFVVEQAVQLTDSTIGFFHLVSEDQQDIIPIAWNKQARQNCQPEYATHYPIAQAGNWADCVRLKRPVIYNDFPNSPNPKGLPINHVPVHRFMSIPVMEGDQVRFIFGVGNKTDEYNETDVVQIQLIASELQKLIKQRHAENALRESEEKFRTLIEQSADGVALLDEEGNLIEWNQANERMTGLARSEIIGLPYWDVTMKLIAPTRRTAERRQFIQSTVLHALQTGQSYLFEQQIEAEIYPQSREEKRYIRQTIFPIKTEKGYRIASLTYDITERKRAEQALYEQQKYSQSLLRLSQNLECAQNYDQVISAAREEVRTIIGYQNLWVYLLSEDQKYFQALVAGGALSETIVSEKETAILVIAGDPMLEEIAAAKGIVVVEDARTDERTNKEIVTRLGNRTLVNIPIFLSDKHLGSIGTGTFGDEGIRVPTPSEQEYLTAMASHVAVAIDRIRLLEQRNRAEQALRRSEDKYRRLFSELPNSYALHEMIYDTDGNPIDYVILEINRSYEQTLNVTSAQVVGKKASHFVPKEELKHWLEIFSLPAHYGKSVHFELYSPSCQKHFEGVAYSLQNNRFAVAFIDITERKKIVDELRQAHQLLETIFDHTHMMVAYFDSQFNFIRVNRAYAQTDEHEPDFFVGKNHFALYPNAENEAIFRQVVQTGKPYFAIAKPFEYADHLKRGISYWDWSLVPIKDPDGQVAGLVLTLLDVTNRLWAEQTLRDSEAKFKSIFAQSPIGIELYDSGGQLIDANPACLRMFGVSDLQAVIGFDLFNDPNVSAETKKKIAMGQSVKYQIIFDFDLAKQAKLYETNKSGQCTLDCLITPMIADKGTITGYLVHALDVTERKRTEEKLHAASLYARSLIEASLDPLVTISPKGKITDVNQATELATGVARENLIGDDFSDYFTEPEKASAGYQQVLAQGFVRDYPLTMRHTIGKTTDVLYNAVVYRNEAGELQGVFAAARDVTERKRMEDELRESESRYRSIFDNSIDGILLTVPDGRILAANPEACRMFGRTEEEIRQVGRSGLIDPTDPRLKLALAERARLGKFISELTCLRKDGTKFPAEVSSVIFKDKNGNQQTSMLIHDITERKRTEEKLHAASLYARSLIEASLDPLVTISPEGKITDVNQATELATGVARENLIGDDFSDYFTEPAQARAGYQQVLAQGFVRDYPLTMRHASAKTIDVLYNATVYKNAAGKIQGVFAAARDVTERKRAEEEIARSLEAEKRAHEIAEILREATESLSRTLKLDEVLENLLLYLSRLVPYDSANVMLLESDSQLHVTALRGYEHWTNQDETRQLAFDTRNAPALDRLITTQKSVLIDDTREYPGWLRPVGTEHVISWLGVPIITEGQVIGLYSVDKVEPGFFTEEHRRLAEGLAGQAAVAIQNTRLHDQIKRSNAELELRVIERTAQLAAANKELEAFAYSVSHDLRAPLRHIDGFLELLQNRAAESLDEKSRHYMTNISESAKRMGVLIDDLLSFSRMGRFELSRMPVDLNTLVQDVLDELKPEVHNRIVHWQVGALPVVTGDRAMLRIVLVNLISNALKFTRPHADAEIEIGCAPGEPGETVIFVRDNGVGFDMNYAGKLFGVFQRLHRQEEFEGTGIGLANVRRIINRHGGRTWAEGQINQGATFYFSLPHLKPGG